MSDVTRQQAAEQNGHHQQAVLTGRTYAITADVTGAALCNVNYVRLTGLFGLSAVGVLSGCRRYRVLFDKELFSMLKLVRSFRVHGASLGLCLALFSVHARAQQVTFLSRQLDRVDVAVGGAAVFSKGVSGTNYLAQPVALDASTTLGAVVQLRYTKSPLLGAEFTYSYARFTENFTGSPFGGDADTPTPFGVQTNASEYTLGYVAHLPSLLGFQPFAGAGAGATAFTPTPMGGQGLPERARASYYYDIGVDDQLTHFIGIRAQFRQVFYKAPDFGQNYLAINQQTITSEPTVGFYIKF